ncbi:MAG: hypothetical protein ACYCXF_00650 [Thermoleophilia bacterium]
MRNTSRLQFVRNLRGMDLFEVFMVSAVTVILGVRLFLKLTDYPQLGGTGIHVAHAEVGGLMMGVSILILLIFLSRRAETVAALIGGGGFGLFMDEVGKFVTRTNDYFFQPSVAIIYLTFIGLYLVVRFVFNSAGVKQIEYMANAIREMQDIPGDRLEDNEKQQILYYLGRCDREDPMVRDLKAAVRSVYAVPTAPPGIYRRYRKRFFGWYRRIAHARWFTRGISFFFIIQFVSSVWVMLSLLFDPVEVFDQLLLFSYAEWAILGSNVVSAIFIAWGILLLRRDHLRAFIMFERSVLVSIFVGQLFLFYKNELGALSGLVFDLLLYVALRFIVDREQDEVIEHAIKDAV